MILVAGGTGTLGSEVVARLLASGRDVRILTRHAGHAQGLGADVATGDVRDPSTLTAAVRGTSTIISAVHGFLGGRGAGPREVDDHGNANLMRAALDAGVQHFVLVSVLDAGPDHPMSLHRSKAAAEQHLRTSGLSWTILRPSSYVETWTNIVGGKLASGGPALVFGRADNPINFVSVQDVATIVEQAITDPALRDRAIDIPGVDNLTMTQLAEHLGASRTKHIPRGALRLLATVLPPVAPSFARQTRAAVVMDTTDMAADPTAVRNAFPDLTWHPAADIARQFSATRRGTRRV
jgi:uncharacterized protein YbjT (DUF2867 family)